MTTPVKSLIPTEPIKLDGKDQETTNTGKYTGILDQEEQVSSNLACNENRKWNSLVHWLG